MLGIQPISSIIHSIVNQVMSEALASTTTFAIKRAKLNYKYRNEKSGGNRPRINKADLRAIHHMLAELPIHPEYDRKTNDIKFIVNHDDKSNAKINKSIELDGYDTGGQTIRTILGLAIKAAMKPKHTLKLPPFTCSSVGKASLLYIQMAANIISEYSSFTVIGGNPYNPDAPKPRDFDRLFTIISQIYGVNLQLIDNTGPWLEEMYRFTLIRKGNTIPLYTEEVISLIVDSHTANQILMSHIFFKHRTISTIKIVIRDIDEEIENENDYHIDAILKIMTALNITFTDITLDETRTIVV